MYILPENRQKDDQSGGKMKEYHNQKSVLILQNVLLGISALLFAVSFVFYLRIQSGAGPEKLETVSAVSSEAAIDIRQKTASYNYSYSTTDPVSSQVSEAIETVASPDHLYTILLRDGAICVFLGEEEPAILKLYPGFEGMPKEDLLLLHRGIYADSASELIRILQDYDG